MKKKQKQSRRFAPKHRKSGPRTRKASGKTKKTKSRKTKPIRKRKVNKLVTDEIIKKLIHQSRGRGFVTEQEIIKAVPHLERDIEGIENLYDRLKDAHIQILEKKEYIDFIPAVI